MPNSIPINPDLLNPFPFPFPSLFDPVVLYGDEGNNLLTGGLGHDSLYGGGGDDSLIGNWGSDALFGGDGQDLLEGNEGNDSLYGEFGNDALDGGSGNDLLQGGPGNDSLTGNTGNDSLDGYKGSESLPLASRVQYDNLTGGTEADLFILGRLRPISSYYGPTDQPIVYYVGDGYATITDFNRTEGDKIQVANDFGLLQYSLIPYAGGTYIRQQSDLIADVKNVTVTASDLSVLRPGFNPIPNFPQF
ncbi:Iron-regulated protein FrpC [Planktothrix tepida]|uniref:Hemolysin-type calcium-binding repeat protein n=2 Tax=Planktothrix TaxID=54304 RepID=A0A1J1LJ76_9CYAN|nr:MULTISPECIES: calcium-binding protein [Planktothrix]CAD5938316.1 Iron-regulated protein FrpC [Planktothrix pseudagardhii]CAD5972151.1 Iron-regulated protein FrpC [Planktothrix tepida]CUR31932.1 Hemolysin-type calcium-binding repeat protein [Planktothrix tepida PCC 9214]